MSEYLYYFLALLILPICLFIMYLFQYLNKKQNYKHQLETLKIKNGFILNDKSNFVLFIKEHLKETVFIIILFFLIIVVCFIFNVPINITKYIIEVLK